MNEPPQPPKRVTLATLAHHAQVHVSTVSRALGPDPSGISPETANRVRELALALGYSRDIGAAGLRTGSSHLIGVLVPRLTDTVLAAIYGSIDEAASRAGYDTVVANTLDDPAQRRSRLDAMLSRRIDGVIIADSHLGDTTAYELGARGIPYVLVMRKLQGHASVGIDDELGGRLAAEHLLDLGHRRIAVIAGDPTVSTGIERTRGFLAACAEAGFPVAPELVVTTAGFDVGGGLAAATRLMALPDSPTAIFTVHDLLAFGAMGAIRNAGKRLGTDVGLVGYNDMDLAATLPTPLTSVRSELDEMGRLSIGMLLQQLAGGNPESVLLPPRLIVRQTTVP
ncbi:LacI family DNA-binding transcriptional regulator [Paeniglutamicibacter cryotolerans]|uniref:LacI family transcriptional regulator n=1 Tax=Paeniglutamicibacter cryotolerans TaxID=670079 RepID=A0A839QD64_9MICC|nr:LacI family DNA-binding transcriptional regulator [Paeniglutamicibacter cryotolerans]MBB2994079.1 LacI family transcriptional regulator [Paeniglutamicibacter cryotolerans]